MPTKVIRGLHNIRPLHKNNVVTIGNFDGVHLGHQALIRQVIAGAKALHTKSMVITFEPHPFEFFSKGQVTIPRLTRMREKILALSALEIDNLLILPFNQELASMPATDFVGKILAQTLAIQEIMIGEDFRFGYKRVGDVDLLKQLSERYHFTVKTLPAVINASERISSTNVRNALLDGDIEKANRLLGRPYTMLGRVRYGKKLGRSIGFPTANIYLHRKLTPLRGVFTVLVHGLAGGALPGVANIGIRPTVDGTQTLLEVHLLNFDQDIYGQEVEVEFCEKLRDEVRFASLDLLIQQIKKDVEIAQNYFEQQGML